MNRIISVFIFSILLLSSKSLLAQGQVVPDGILFQAVARDANNNAAGNRNVYIQIYIKKGTISGSTDYSESFKVVSTSEGIFSIVIGQGTRMSGATSLKLLDWTKSLYFVNIKIAIEPTLLNPDWKADNNYVDIGTSQLWTVPYAFASETTKYADSSGTIVGILPGAKGGTGVANTGKTITIANNLVTKGIGDLTITTTAASNVVFPTSGTIATIKDIGDILKSDTISLSNRINTKLDSSQFPVLIAPYLQTISGMKYSDTAAMLNNRFARDTVSLSNRVNTKLDSSQFPLLIAPYLQTISGMKYSDTAAMLNNRFARDTVSLSNRINLKADKLNAKIDSSLYVKGKTTITDTIFAKSNVLIDSNLLVKGLKVATVLGAEALKNKSVNGVTPSAIDNGFTITGGVTTSPTLTVLKDFVIGGENRGDQYINLIGDVVGDGVGTFTTTVNKIGGKPVSLGGPLTTAGSFTTAGNYTTTLTSTGNTSVTLPTTGTLATLNGTESLTNKIINGVTPSSQNVGFSISGGTSTSTTLTVLKDVVLGGVNTGDQYVELTGDVTGGGFGTFTSTVNVVGGVSSSTIATLPTLIAANTASITTNTSDILLRATIASPSFTGTPTAVTASPGSSSTQLATTEFVSNLVTGAATPDADAITKGKVQLTGDLGGTAASPTVNNIGGKPIVLGGALTTSGTYTTTITTTGNTNVTLPTTGTIATLSGTETLTNKTINGVRPTAQNVGFSISGGTSTSTTLTVLKDVVLGGVNTGDQYFELTGDVTGGGFGTFTSTVTSVGGVSASTITTVASNVLSATSTNTPNTIVKRDNNGDFSTGTITGTLSGTASNANALTTGRTIGITGDITYTSPNFDGTSNITGTGTLTNTGVTANTYGSSTYTSTSVPTITVDSKGRITNAIATNIPSATSTVTGLLTSSDFAVFSAKQGALTPGSGITIASGTISATDATSSAKGIIQLTGDLGGTAESPLVNKIGGKAITLGGTLTTAGNYTTTITATDNTNVTLPTSGTLATLSGTETLTNKTINGVRPTALATGFSIAGGTTTNTTLTVIGDVTIGGVNSGDQLITLTGDVSGSGTGTFTTTINSLGGVSSSTITTVASSVLSATSDNTPNTIVKRDGSGGFSTGTITGTLSGTASNANALTTGRTISTTGDVSYTSPAFNGTADVTGAATINTVGGVSSSTITAVASNVLSATSTNTANTIVKRDANGDFAAGSITATAISSGTLSLTTPLSIVSGGTGTNTSTGIGSVVLSTSPTLTGTPRAPTASVITDDDQIATTAFVKASITNASVSDATATTKGILKLTNDLGGTAALPTVNSVGGVLSSTITSVASNVLSATSDNTPNTIVKRDGSGGFSTGTITGTLSGTASNANALTTGRTISTTGDVTYTSGAFDGVADVTGVATLANSGVVSGTYGTSTSIPTITVDSKGRITNAIATNIPSATSTVTGLLTSSDFAVFSAKQGALTPGSGITIASGTISATDATSSAKGIIQLTGDLGGTAESPLVNKIGGKAITLGGTLTTAGNYTTTITATDNTNVTLPTSGTLATLSGTETLTNKTINGVRPTALATGFSIAGGTSTNTTLTVIGDVTIGGVNSGDQLITLTGDVSGSGTGTFTTTINSIGGVSSSTITSVASSVNSATSSNTANTIVKRDGSGDFAAGTITATAISSGTLSLTTPLSIVSGGTGTNTATGTGLLVLSTSPALTGTPTAVTADATSNSTQIATTAFVKAQVGGSVTPDADANTKGKLQLTNDLGGTAALPTVNSVGGVLSSTITTVASNVLSATSDNTPNTIVKRDVNGGFSTGTITGTLSGTASNANALTTGRTITTTGDVTYTSGAFNGTADVTGVATLANSGVVSGTYGTSTSVPTITVDSKGRITNAIATNIPSATSTVTGLLTSSDYQAFSAKQGALIAGSGISISGGTISATGITSSNLSATAGITNGQLANSAITLGSTSMSLGGTYTNVTGLSAISTETLKVTSGNYTATGAVLTTDGTGNAVWNSSGLYTLNGITAASQTFSTTTAATSNAPSFTSSGTVHTLNIPSASVTGTTAGLLSNAEYAVLNAKQGALTAGAGITIASGTISATDATSTAKGIIQLTNDLGGTAALPTVNSVGGVSSSTITTVASNVLSATSTNTANTIVKRDGSGDFAAGTITATAISSGTLSLTTPLSIVSGGTGTNTATGTGLLVLSTSPALTGTPTAVTADPSNSSTQIATTAFVKATVGGSATPDADVNTKGKVQLTGDLGGSAGSPTVVGIGGKSIVLGGALTTAGNFITSGNFTTTITTTDNTNVTFPTSGRLATIDEVSSAVGGSAAVDATSSVKGIIKLTNDLGGTAALPTVNSVGGVVSSTITTVASNVLSATSSNTANTIVKRDGSGDFSTGTITGTLSGTASNANTLTTGRTISTTGDVSYTSPTFNGSADVTAAATVNSVGGVSSSTITTVASNVLSATSSNTANTIVKRDGNGDFAAGAITATSVVSSGNISSTSLTAGTITATSLTLTNPLAIASGGTGTYTSTGTGSVVLSTSPALTGTPTAITAEPGSNSTQIATTAFVARLVSGSGASDATSSTKGIIQLTNDLGGTAALPTVNSVGGVSSSTITTVASSVLSATSLNTANTIVKRDVNGDFSTGTITGTLSGTASGLTTARTIGITGDITYSTSFNGTVNVTGVGTLTNTGVTANTYGSSTYTSTSVPTITVDSKGRITSATTTNIPSATNTVTGLLTSSDYIAFSAKQGALTAGAGITIASGTISATDATSTAKGIVQLTNDLGGTAALPTVNSVGGVSSSTITTVASNVLSATSSNTANTIVKRDGSGGFAAGAITATSVVSSGNISSTSLTTGTLTATAVVTNTLKVTGGSYTATGAVLTTDGTGNAVWNSSGLYTLNGITAAAQTFSTTTAATSTTPSFTSSGTVHTLNIPSATVTGTTAGLLSNAEYAALNAKQGALTAGAGITIASGTISATDATTSAKGIVQLTNDLGGTAALPTVNSVGGVSSSTITTVASNVLSATSSNTANTIVKRDGSGGFAAGAITATSVVSSGNISSTSLTTGTLTATAVVTNTLKVTGGSYTATGAVLTTDGTGNAVWNSSGLYTLNGITAAAQTFSTTTAATSTTPSFTSSGTVHTLNIPSATVTGTTAGLLSNAEYTALNAKQGALTAGAGITIASGTISATDATTTAKGIVQLTNDLGGTAALPTVNSVGGVSSSTITTVASNVLSATSSNTANTIVKRDGSGGFAAGAITATSVVSSGNISSTSLTTGTLTATAVVTNTLKVTGGSYTATGAVLTTDGTGNAVWNSSGLYTLNGITAAAQTFSTTTAATSTTPSFTSSGTVHTLNIPSATVTGTTAGLLSNSEYAALNAKQGALTAGSGISITGGTISATGITSGNLSTTAGITNQQLANSSVTLGSTVMSLGGTYTNVTGLSSVTSTLFTGTLSGTASGLTTPRTISTTGDVTSTGNFDGTANLSLATTLANSGVASGTYGSSSVIPKITVDAKGRITSLEEVVVGASAIGAPLGTNKIIVGNYSNTAQDVYVTGDVGITSTGVTTVNSVGGVLSSTITSVASNVLSATSTNTPNTIVRRDGSGNFAAGAITSTSINTGTLTATSVATNTLNVTAGSYTTTGAVLTSDGNGNATWGSSGLYTLNGITAAGQTFSTTTNLTSTKPSFTSSGTVHTLNIPYAGVTGTEAGLLSYNQYQELSGKQGALTAGAGINIVSGTTTATISATDATSTTKGIVQLTNDLGGTAALPTVNSVGGVLSSTITSIASSVNSATSVNTPNTIVKRDGSGNFAAGAITSTSINTGTLTATSVVTNTLKVTGGSYTTTNAVLTTDGTGNAVWSSNGLYTLNGITAAGQTFSTTTSPSSTSPSFTSSGTIHTLNIPYAGVTGTTAGLLSYEQYAALNSKQDALTLGTGVASFLASPTSTNLATAVTNDVGTGSLVFSNNPTLTNATLSGTLTLTTPLSFANGGTGQSTYAKGDILYASDANTLSKLSIGSTGQVLVTTIAGVPAWGSNGLFSLNGQSATTHNFATSNSGIDFAITSSVSGGTATHTFNLPDADGTTGNTKRGLLSTGTQSIAGNKTFTGGTTNFVTLIASGYVTAESGLKVKSAGYQTAGAVLTSSGDANGSANWSTNLNVGTITATSLTTGALKVTGGTIANGSVLISDANGNATWGSNGVYALNGQSATTHNFATSNSGTDFAITSSTSGGTATHTYNLPDASATNRGVVTTGIQTFAGSKTFSGTTTVGTLKVTNGAPTTVGAVLTASATDGTVAWSTSNSASSLSGGVAGAIPYQTAPNTTGFTAAGTSGQILVSGGTLTPTWTSNISVGTVTATGNFSGTSADFSKAVTGAPASGTSGTSIDFSQSNLAYTSASAGIFTLNGMKNGGTYTLAVQGGTSGTLNPSGGGFSYVSLGNYATVSGKHTVYTFVVMGGTVYYSMVSAQ